MVNVCAVTIFSTVYYVLREEGNWNGMDNESTFFDCFYFSFTTMTTIGYGDISPSSKIAKIFCLCQQLIVLFQLANLLSKLAIQKKGDFRIKLKKKSRIKEKIGRQRRYNSCQLDYHRKPSFTLEST